MTSTTPVNMDSAAQLHPDDLDVFTSLRMTAFGQAVIDIANDATYDEWTFSAKIRLALKEQIAAKQERRFQKLLTASRSPNLDACVEEIRYLPNRNLNKELVARLASCQWIDAGTNLVIIGNTSVGKTYLAQALINAACRADHTCLFYRLDDLEADLAVLDPADPQRATLVKKLKGVDLLVIDDFLTTPVTDATASVILNVLSARESVGSTLITSQFEPSDWYKSISDAVLAESILSRLIGGAQILNLDGPNLRLGREVEPLED